jgi:hypothetical protein
MGGRYYNGIYLGCEDFDWIKLPWDGSTYEHGNEHSESLHCRRVHGEQMLLIPQDPSCMEYFYVFVFLYSYILQFHFKSLKLNGHNIITYNTVYLRILYFVWFQKQQQQQQQQPLIISLYKSNRWVCDLEC